MCSSSFLDFSQLLRIGFLYARSCQSTAYVSAVPCPVSALSSVLKPSASVKSSFRGTER